VAGSVSNFQTLAVVLASIRIGGIGRIGGIPLIIMVMGVTVMPLRVVRRIPPVRTVVMGATVMPSRGVSIIVAAARIIAAVGAESGIAAAAGDEEAEAAEDEACSSHHGVCSLWRRAPQGHGCIPLRRCVPRPFVSSLR
jgi:hypothetical protein